MDRCSFCGRDKKEVELLVAGISGHICNSCIDQAYDIVMEESRKRGSFDVGQIKIIKPNEIKSFLDIKG